MHHAGSPGGTSVCQEAEGVRGKLSPESLLVFSQKGMGEAGQVP